MRNLHLSILVIILAIFLTGCSLQDQASEAPLELAFRKKKECATYLPQLKKITDKIEDEDGYTIGEVEVFYSKSLNTCIGKYIELYIKPPYTHDTYAIQDMLTNNRLFYETYNHTDYNGEKNALENVSKKEFEKKLTELKN